MARQPDLADLHFDEAPSVTTELPGPNSAELLEKQAAVESGAVAYPQSIPIGIEAAKGATVKDVDGNVFLDFFAGMGVLNVGHSNPYVLDAVEEQLRKVTHTVDFPTEVRVELIEKLDEIVPGDLQGSNRVLFGGPSGSDAIEASIKIAKYHTGGSGLIAFRGSYHGATTGALSLTGGRVFKEPYAPLLADVHHCPYPHPTQSPASSVDHDGTKICPVDATACCGNWECARSLRDVQELLEDPYGGLSDPAGIWIEPVQATGGIVTPPAGFLRGLKQLAAEHDIPLILDEIQTGFGRTGEWFACEHYDVTPDIMPVSKSIGGIGLPLAATILDESLDLPTAGHVGTFRGNAPAMAGGIRAIEYLQDQNLVSRAERLGRTIETRLEALRERFERIIHVRGHGLMWGLEFVDAEDGDAAKETVNRIQRACYERGVLVWTAGRRGEVLRVMPPLVVTEDQLETGTALVTESIESVLQ